MRASVLLAVFFGSFFLVAEGCARPTGPSSFPTTGPHPVEALELPGRPAAELDGPGDAIPRVVRRILAEEKDIVARSLALAEQLEDPLGRARAVAEASDLAREVARIDAALTSVREVAVTEALDDVVDQLLRLDTRALLLHEKLRGATNRTTAVVVD